MATESPTIPEDEGLRLLGVAVVAGLAAGLARPFAGVLVAGVGALPVELHHATAGVPTLAVRVHLVYSVAFAAAFVAALSYAAPGRLRAGTPAIVVLAVAYGVVLWVLNVAVVWPLLQSALGLGVHHVPHLHLGPLVVHLLYGLALGGAVIALQR